MLKLAKVLLFISGLLLIFDAYLMFTGNPNPVGLPLPCPLTLVLLGLGLVLFVLSPQK